MALLNQPQSLIGLENAIKFLKDKINDPDVTPEFKAEAQRRIQIYTAQNTKLYNTSKKMVGNIINSPKRNENATDHEVQLVEKFRNKKIEFADVGLTPNGAAGNTLFAKAGQRIESLNYLTALKFGVAAYIIDALIPAGALGNAVQAIATFVQTHPDLLGNLFTTLVSGNVVGAAILGAVAVVGLVKLFAPAFKKIIAKKALDRELSGIDFDNMNFDPTKKESVEEFLNKNKKANAENASTQTENKTEEPAKNETTTQTNQQTAATTNAGANTATQTKKSKTNTNTGKANTGTGSNNKGVPTMDNVVKDRDVAIFDFVAARKVFNAAAAEYEKACKAQNKDNNAIASAEKKKKAAEQALIKKTKALEKALSAFHEQVNKCAEYNHAHNSEETLDSIKENFAIKQGEFNIENNKHYDAWKVKNSEVDISKELKEINSYLSSSKKGAEKAFDDLKLQPDAGDKDAKFSNFEKTEYKNDDGAPVTLEETILNLTDDNKPNSGALKTMSLDALKAHNENINSRITYEQKSLGALDSQYTEKEAEFIEIQTQINEYYSLTGTMEPDALKELIKKKGEIQNELENLSEKLFEKSSKIKGLESYQTELEGIIDNEKTLADDLEAAKSTFEDYVQNKTNGEGNIKAKDAEAANTKNEKYTAFKQLFTLTVGKIVENPEEDTSKLNNFLKEKKMGDKLKLLINKLIEVFEELREIAKNAEKDNRAKIVADKAKELGVGDLVKIEEASHGK